MGTNHFTETPIRRNKVNEADRAMILQYFLYLYRLQTGAQKNDPSEYMATAQSAFDPLSTYKLRVLQAGEWKTRRITIDSLGNTGGSKSKCFKVFFDDVLVVKIPPKPIVSFKEYLEQIETEKRIADHLKPEIECITPTVSCILRRIPPFNNDAHLPPDQFEKKCISRLMLHPNLHHFLKIGDSFVFFMNLSKYVFLSTVIENIHGFGKHIEEEILKQGDVLWDIVVFEQKYGPGLTDRFFYELNDIYNDFEQRIQQLFKTQNGAGSIPSFKVRDWFLLFLAGRNPDEEELKREGPVSMEVFDSFFTGLQKVYQKPIVLYRKAIKRLVFVREFNRMKPLMGGIVANILHLLALLKKKGVAIRDLKPENVFVVGDVDKNPLLLAHPDDFAIGLIDFETSIRYGTGFDKIRQPMLAGTPSYATPSHLFQNEILKDTYKDFKRILYLQDWQAAVSMIYIVVAGEHLAVKTSRVLPEIIKTMKTPTDTDSSMGEVFARSSVMFWKRASEEFQEKVEKNRAKFESVEAFVTEEAWDMLSEEMNTEKEIILSAIRESIVHQKFFRSDKARKGLYLAPSTRIAMFREKWEKGVGVPKTSPAIRKRIINFLSNIEKLKAEKEILDNVFTKLKGDVRLIPIYDLIKAVFRVVFHAMYKPEWETIYKDTGLLPEEESELTAEATVAYEKTVAYVPEKNS